MIDASTRSAGNYVAAVGLSIQIFQFLEKQPHMLSGSLVAEVSPEKCAAQVSEREKKRGRVGDRERETSLPRCVECCGLRGIATLN